MMHENVFIMITDSFAFIKGFEPKSSDIMYNDICNITQLMWLFFFQFHKTYVSSLEICFPDTKFSMWCWVIGHIGWLQIINP